MSNNEIIKNDKSDSDLYLIAIPDYLGGGLIKEEEYKPTLETEGYLKAILGTLQEGSVIDLGYKSMANEFFGSEDGIKKLALFSDEEVATKIFRTTFSSQELRDEEYGLSEAIRMVSPIISLIESKESMNIDLLEEEKLFLVRCEVLEGLRQTISKELSKPYRAEEDVENKERIRVDEEGIYTFEDESIANIDKSKRVFLKMLVDEAPLVKDDSTTNQLEFLGSYATDAAKLSRDSVADFLSGKIKSVSLGHLLKVHSYESAEHVSSTFLASEIGKLSVLATQTRNRTFAWNGRQIAYDTPWYSVVSGGDASQN